MTGEAMGAGEALDRLIAERVMGWKPPTGLPDGSRWTGAEDGSRRWLRKDAPGEMGHDEFMRAAFWTNPAGEFTSGQDLPAYSTSIAAAWKVAERVIELAKNSEALHRQTWGIELDEDELWHAGFTEEKALAETAPLAICRSSLMAVAATGAGKAAGKGQGR